MSAEEEYVSLRIDGCSRNNPGVAGIGILIEDNNGKALLTRSKSVGIKTNNQAEYLALIEGLRLVRNLGSKKVRVFSDSLLLVKQMKGEFKVREKSLRLLQQKARKIESSIDSVEYFHVSRKENTRADFLANNGAERQLESHFS